MRFTSTKTTNTTITTMTNAALAMVRASLRTIGPRFGATRMVSDYVERVYPASGH